MKLDREQVMHIAELAQVSLTDEEAELFTEQLSEILDYFGVLGRLDTSAIPPTAQAIERRNVLREDQVRPSLHRDEALANAPQRDGHHFKVKAIFE
ncbi:MAG: Asp-tRNA(Asn)/Glu-tRNA(Gln) amidotransferase subunit GatC [Chloroflexi bacterium]|nr:Asp-tRNA(Asn)/Glu-tRNA(Gln) amidotransferase subunit GatC [Chloroflexota bacterium]